MFMFFRAKYSRVVDSNPIPYEHEFFRPGFLAVFPRGLPCLEHCFVFLKLWVMQYCLLRDPNFVAIVVKDGQNIIHYSIALSACYRFPFMLNKDIQIGPSWTAADYRRKGIASYAISILVKMQYKPYVSDTNEGNVWWICDSKNSESIKTISKAGFMLIGEGVKEPVMGLALLGKYNIIKKYNE